ncbi:MAG: SDR family NAD(P)-dependent oxidoreductase, partial [Acidimicrobiia bacterium]|nr:SDR family NAD(P)-dependent oxidoreductase [Acidimicrobiia bacterium]
MNTVANLIDKTLEATVAPSFTRVGIGVRERVFDWTPLERLSMTGKTVAITGVTSGIGRAAAEAMASLGANLVLIGRDEEKMQRVQSELSQRAAAAGSVSYALADLGVLEQVHDAATAVSERHHELHGLIHNAGALFNERRIADDGMELTTKVQVVAPFLLTSLLMPNLTAGRGRVLTMSSGGMYTAGLTVSSLQMPEDTYSGTQQYARAKRAQVTLNEMWAERHGDSGVAFHALHPGWVDTPGVSSALPGFGKVLGPLLRSPEQGADTLVWLAAAPL